VCFYHVCRTTAGFYGTDSEQAAFWRKSCLRAGICFSGRDASYKDVAFEVIKRDGFCGHADCGGAQLDQNALAVEHAMKVFGWDPEDEDFDEALYEKLRNPDPASDPAEPTANSIFSQVKFSRSPTPKVNSMLLYYPFYLRRQSGFNWNPVTSEDRRIIKFHPIICRSMATFPATAGLSFTFDRLHEPAESMQRTVTVTVLDVLCDVSHSLDEELSVQRLLTMLDGPFASAQSSDGAYTTEMLSRFQTLRGLAARCRLNGLTFIPGSMDADELPFELQFGRDDDEE